MEAHEPPPRAAPARATRVPGNAFDDWPGCSILTDSGGLQEEAVVLGVPCITMRDNTERPITVEVGANRVVGQRPESILKGVQEALSEGKAKFRQPDKWDGLAAGRIVETLLQAG